MMANKKGISVMVSYVLLIVIAIALSTVVYTYLKSIAVSNVEECSPDISLIPNEISCDKNLQTISFKLENRGFFNVSAAYIRFGPSNRSVRMQLNENYEIGLKGQSDLSPLIPGELTPIKSYFIGNLLDENVDDYILEIQPAVISNRKLVPCDEAIVSMPIECI